MPISHDYLSEHRAYGGSFSFTEVAAALLPQKDAANELLKLLYAAQESGAGFRAALQHRRGLRTMAHRGWYFFEELTWGMVSLYGKYRKSESDLQWLDVKMEESVLAHAGTTLAQAAQQFPRRADILAKIAERFAAQDYISAVPLILAQSDGMAKDITKACLFYDNKQRKKKFVSSYKITRRADRWILSALLPVLNMQGAFHRGHEGLSRHLILHGEDLAYGTSATACKSLSLLGYMVLLKTWLQRPDLSPITPKLAWDGSRLLITAAAVNAHSVARCCE